MGKPGAVNIAEVQLIRERVVANWTNLHNRIRFKIVSGSNLRHLIDHSHCTPLPTSIQLLSSAGMEWRYKVRCLAATRARVDSKVAIPSIRRRDDNKIHISKGLHPKVLRLTTLHHSSAVSSSRLTSLRTADTTAIGNKWRTLPVHANRTKDVSIRADWMSVQESTGNTG